MNFVFLINDAAAGFLAYVNAFLEAANLPPIAPESKFARIEFDDYALGFERHTEFFSIAFIQKGWMIRCGLLAEAFDA